MAGTTVLVLGSSASGNRNSSVDDGNVCVSSIFNNANVDFLPIFLLVTLVRS